MSAISLKSITGITSITTPAGVDNQLTLHTNNTAERLRITSGGDFGVGTASPTARLDVRRGDTDGKIAEFHQSTGYGIDIGSSQADAYISSGYIQNFILKTNQGSGQVERLRIDSTGKATFSGDVQIDGDELFIADSIKHVGDTDTLISFPSNDTINFRTAGTERLRITSAGKVCIAHTNALHSGNLQISTAGADAIDINSYSTNANSGGRLSFYRSKNASIGSNTIVADDDSLGRIDFRGYNTSGNSYDQGATIEARVDGAVGSTTDMPTAILFKTSGDGSASPDERLRITSGGSVNIGSASAVLTQTTFKAQIETGTNKLISFGNAEHNDLSDEGSGIFFSRQSDGADKISGIFQHTNLSLGVSGRGGLTLHAGGNSFYSAAPERLRITADGDVAIGRNAALANYSDGSTTTTKLAVVDNVGGSGYHEVAHFTAGTDSNDTGAIVRITHKLNDRGLFIKAGRGTGDQAKAIIGLRNSSTTEGNWITLTQNIDQITCHKSVDIDNGVNLSLGGTSGTHAPLHVKSENTSYGKNAVFGAKGWVNNANYHYTDATISLLGRDRDDNDKGVGIEFSARNTGDSNWLHGALTMGQDGHIRFFGGGAGTTQGTEKLRIDHDGRLLIGAVRTYDTGTYYDDITINNSNTSSGSAGGAGISLVSGNDSWGGLIFSDSDMHARGYLKYDHGDDKLVFGTASNNRLRIDSSGRVIVGGSSAGPYHQDGDNLNLYSGGNTGMSIFSGTSSLGSIFFADGNNDVNEQRRGAIQYNHNGDYLAFWTNAGEKLRINSDGRLLINKTTNRNKYFNGIYSGQLQVESTNDSTRVTQFVQNSNNSSPHYLVIGKSRGTSVGSYSIVQNSDYLGTLSFQGADGDEMVNAASIEARVNNGSGDPGNDDMPADLIFKTNQGHSAPRETLRITAKGQFLKRQQGYGNAYQDDNFGNAMVIKSGWMRFNSAFSNPTKDLVILADGGNNNNNLYIKVTVVHLDYPGTDYGIGNIHMGYASAKRKGDGSGKWHVEKSTMALESGSNFHGHNGNVGTLAWSNSNPSDTNTLSYTSNRHANYDMYNVQVEVWQNGNCSYYLHEDFVD